MRSASDKFADAINCIQVRKPALEFPCADCAQLFDRHGLLFAGFTQLPVCKFDFQEYLLQLCIVTSFTNLVNNIINRTLVPAAGFELAT
jgi:hypothetical protein